MNRDKKMSGFFNRFKSLSFNFYDCNHSVVIIKKIEVCI